VFLVPPMLVVVGSVLDQLLCARRRKIFGYALCILAAPLLLYTLRSDTLAVLKLFVFGACAPLLALRIATGIRH